MPDMVKVINALTLCTTQFDESVMVAPCKQCPYYTGRDLCDIRQMMLDTIELLKEQEEKITMMRMIYGTDAKVVGELVRCNACKHGTPCNVKINCEKDIGTFKTTLHSRNWFCADGERCEGH